MAITTCTITGNVKNLLGSNVVGATIRVSTLAPFIHPGGPSFIAGEISSVTTDASGNFSVAVIETQTPGVKLNFTLEYYDGLSAKKTKSYAVVIPNNTSATLASLITAPAAVATVTTFPGSSVTIVPNGNMVSTDAQAAIYALQGGIDALNALPSGKIYLGNSLGVAAEVTPSGAVTIDNTGVTSITAGAINNSHINAAAAIAYSKLALTGSVVNADIGASAAIAYSKLALAGSIVNADIASGAAIAYAKLNLAGSIVNADIATSAAIAYSKLALTGSIVNADIGASAAIAYSKLALAASIVNADIASGAAIALSKLAAVTASRVLVSDGSGVVSPSAVTSTTLGFLDATSSVQTQLDAKVAKSTLTTKGDLFVATGASTVTRLGVGSDTQILTADSSQASGMKWAAAPSAPAVPTVQRFLSGSGTYTLPATCRWIRVRLVGGGGGGGGSGTTTTGSQGGDGTSSTFGTLTAPGGSGGHKGNDSAGGAGAAAPTVGAGFTALVSLAGAAGENGVGGGATFVTGGSGGATYFGGAGTASFTSGKTAITNSGSGGGGAGPGATAAASTAGGGGAGAFIEALSTSPSATYSYAVGGGGAGGAAGTSGNNGGSGADGAIIVEEFY